MKRILFNIGALAAALAVVAIFDSPPYAAAFGSYLVGAAANAR